MAEYYSIVCVCVCECVCVCVYTTQASSVAQTVKNLPAVQDTRIQSLGQDPGEGNGNPLQYSYLKNSMDRGAWQAAVHGVTCMWISLQRIFCSHQNLIYLYARVGHWFSLSLWEQPSVDDWQQLSLSFNSCPLSQWYHPTISSSITPYSSCPKSFPASGSFPMNHWLPNSDAEKCSSFLASQVG